MATVAKAMACPESGLEVRDRMWLKITIANAFIGMSVVILHFFFPSFISTHLPFSAFYDRLRESLPNPSIQFSCVSQQHYFFLFLEEIKCSLVPDLKRV